MKTLIIYESSHHGNTKKVAERISKVLNAKLSRSVEILNLDILDNYDLIGFGSGYYGTGMHKDLLSLIDRLSSMKNKKAFIFNTSGAGEKNLVKNQSKVREKLTEKGFKIVGQFACKGFITWGPFKIFGGRNKGRPNEEDLKKAEEFGNSLKNYNKEVKK